MSETKQAAALARTRLARGLAALQADGVPFELRQVAEPVARSMGLLHEIEHGNGKVDARQGRVLLGTVREALAILQRNTQAHPAVQRAIEAVASALSTVYALAQPGPASVPPQAGTLYTAEAALGAHSSSNFYLGLNGRDVIESGGIFIATYRIPPLGQQLLVQVTMPGGHEFEARAVVTWVREASSVTSAELDASPGFGAKFIQVSREGRDLVARYVRNREPLFHEDP
jgi:hypothetical protein